MAAEKLLPATIACMLACSATISSGAQAPDAGCKVEAFVLDPDPKGLNVRAGPNRDAQVIGNLPARSENINVTITAAMEPWVQIVNAAIAGDGKIIFKGPGWVFGPLLGVEAHSSYSTGTGGKRVPVKVYKEANARSPVVSTLTPGLEVKILGCSGQWVKIQHEKATGWLDPASQCAAQLTECS